MHRNTLFVVIFLAIAASLVIGVHIGRQINPQVATTTPTPTAPPLALTPTPIAASLLTYANTYCGFSFSYPSTHTLQLGASGSAVLTNESDTILMACQADIPRPPLVKERIGEATIAGATNAKLYHDASPKDGARIDELMFTNPKNGLDVFISGLGPAFDQIISSIQLLP